MLLYGGYLSEGTVEGRSYFKQDAINRYNFVQYLCFTIDRSFVYENIIKRAKEKLLFLAVV